MIIDGKNWLPEWEGVFYSKNEAINEFNSFCENYNNKVSDEFNNEFIKIIDNHDFYKYCLWIMYENENNIERITFTPLTSIVMDAA
jgi:hypothetical protein